MATANKDSCQVCTNVFNAGSRRSVVLPCGHHFCLSCLGRLKAGGKLKCPVCRCNWAGFDVPAVPGMEALAVAMHADQEDEGDITKKKGLFDRCEKHSRHFEYWAKDIKVFYCTRCAAENRHVEIDLIEDVIPQIKAVLTAEVSNAEEKVQNNLELLDERHAELEWNRNSIIKFMNTIQALDNNFKQEIQDIEGERSKIVGSSATLRKLKRTLTSLTTMADINVAVECTFTLKKVSAPSSVSTSGLPTTLLCNIARSYLEEATTANPPSKKSFVDAVLKGGPKPSLKTVHAAAKLKKCHEWTVDYNNCEAALLALADLQPSVLRLVARVDTHKALPVAAIAKAAKGCKVDVRFFDTFYSANNNAKDAERLEDLTANRSLHLDVFYGHLDHSAIAKLPHTITDLNLAIGSAADAAAVSSLRPWVGLKWLCVSVSSRVAASDLKPLPDGPGKLLYFPFLSDFQVDSVRPAIEALVPDLRIRSLHFPICQLTAAGASRMTQQLRGVAITNWVTIETSGIWCPGSGQKESVEAELRSATGCSAVDWGMDWIYE